MWKLLTMSLIGWVLGGCSTPPPQNKAVFLLLDTSGTYTEELKKGQKIINYLLAVLDSGDSMAVGRIDSGSFSEKDIVAKVTFDGKPSVSHEQKRVFMRRIDEFVHTAQSSNHTDISGGVLQATEYLNETGAKYKYILIFSDLEEDLVKGQIRDFAIPLTGVKVVALNVTKLRSDNIDPRDYLTRLDNWEQRVTEGGGVWSVVNDLEHLEGMLKI